MATLVGAFLLTLLVVGAAALSGHPLPLIAVALVVGAVVLIGTRRTDRWAGLRRRR
jgi:hypothetical protein